MKKVDWKHWACVTVTVAGVVLALWMLGHYALSLFLPFLLAFVLALLTRPLARRISAVTRTPLRLCSALCTLHSLGLLGCLAYWLTSRLLLEMQNLILFLAEDLQNPEGEIARILAFFRGLAARFPFLERLSQAELLSSWIGDPSAFFAERMRDLIARLSEGVGGFVTGLLRRLPSILLFVLVTVISCFYFSVEFDTVKGVIYRILPEKWRVRFPEWQSRASGAFRRYLRAYLLLFLLTLAELTVGFLLLSVRYPFLLALLTAILDILPVLGVGTVLIPYALLSLLTGNVARGIWLLVLYAVITIVRQVAEPHLVGKSLGLHPILMLVCIYVAFRLFGVAGILLCPLLALLAKAFFAKGIAEDNEKPPV
ncbi:MAG: sporulation integral membrane protein YtvI [Clostridia bacterium]|nr:sporulation integral membrane protein YtvI [Clostridia bacterium]